MTVSSLIFVIVSALLGGLNYFLTKNLIFSLLIFLIFISFFFLVLFKKIQRYKKGLSRSYECVNFINSFIISLSVNGSVYSTYNKMKESASKDLKNQMNAVEHLEVEEQISYLYKYFDIPIYGVFINIINQFILNGGDILSISHLLIQDSRSLENQLLEYEISGKSKLKEMVSSWALNTIILLIMNISLINLYPDLIKIQFYPILIFIYFLLLLFNLVLFTNNLYNLSFVIKGENSDEKTQTKNIEHRFKSKVRIKHFSHN